VKWSIPSLGCIVTVACCDEITKNNGQHPIGNIPIIVGFCIIIIIKLIMFIGINIFLEFGKMISFYLHEKYFILINRIRVLSGEFFLSWGAQALLIWLLLMIFCSYRMILVRVRKSPSFYAFCIVEIPALTSVLVAYNMPWKCSRFISGLFTFSHFMVIHSKTLYLIFKNKEATNNSKNNLTKGTITAEFINIITFNVYEDFISISPHLPSIENTAYILLLILLNDCSIWLKFHIIPNYISPTNQHFALGLLSGIYIIYAMELNYRVAEMIANIFGCSIPLQMRHNHPLLSTSIAEFWGTRWNPVIGNLLKKSFYKPLRNFGFPRIYCITSCFIGSALLHSIPQYFAENNVIDSIKISEFFMLQIACVLLESQVEKLFYKKTANQSLVILIKSTYFYYFGFFVEFLTISTILVGFYLFLECSKISILSYISFFLLSIINIFLFLMYQIKIHNVAITRISGMMVVLRWAFTLSLIIALLPLFSIPVHHALNTLYSESIIIQPFLNAVIEYF